MRIMVVTGSRADWSALEMTALALTAAGHSVCFCVGACWVPAEARRAFADAGFAWAGCYLLPDAANATGDRPAAISGLSVAATADACRVFGAKLVLLCGDRYEVLGSALGAYLAGVPIAHLSGGDRTSGSADDAMRDAITALASLHFPTHQDAADRLVAMGAPVARVHNVGSPAVDRLLALPLVSDADAFPPTGIAQHAVNVMVAVHPETMPGAADTCGEVLHGLVELETHVDGDVAFFVAAPCADVGADMMRTQLQAFCDARPGRAALFGNLPPDQYIALLGACDVMVGNSSSGVYEAPVLGVPSVIVGDRQAGRPRTAWAEVPAERGVIARRVRDAVRLSHGLAGVTTFGDGHAAERIAAIIGRIGDPKDLLRRTA